MDYVPYADKRYDGVVEAAKPPAPKPTKKKAVKKENKTENKVI